MRGVNLKGNQGISVSHSIANLVAEFQPDWPSKSSSEDLLMITSEKGRKEMRALENTLTKFHIWKCFWQKIGQPRAIGRMHIEFPITRASAVSNRA
jgi:hypothetical protein